MLFVILGQYFNWTFIDIQARPLQPTVMAVVYLLAAIFVMVGIW